MTSSQLRINSFGLFWLLTTVYIVRDTSITLTAAKRTLTATYSLIIQRPFFAGGFLAIPLDGTVQLTQRSTKDVVQNTIRLQYGPKGKHLIMRAANAVERKEWIGAIVDSLEAHHALKSVALTTLRASSETAPLIDQGHRQDVFKTLNASSYAVPPVPLYSLDAIKRLADGYNSLAQEWAQAATETRQFHAEISGLQSLRVDSKHCAVHCTA